MRSESIANIAKALSQAQAVIARAEMDSTNPFLKNKYASLGSVIKAIQPVLKPNGLSYTQIVEGEGATIGVITVLMHESGEWIESRISMPLGEERGKSLAQAAGGIITYLRRYSLSAIFGVYAEEDTDAAQKVEKKAEAKPEPIPAGPELSLEAAMAVTNSEGKLYGELTTEVLSHMANSIAKKIKAGGYKAEELEGMQYKLSAIRTLLASDRPEPGQ